MAPDVPTRTVDDEVLYRYSDYDTPFWARSNTKAGRWHEAGDGPTQYLSFTTDCAWADLIRNEDLRTEEDVALVRMPLWQCRIDQSYIVDYSEFEKAETAGFPPDALIDDDQTRCRAEGKRLRGIGYSGIAAPAAALPGHVTLTLFGPRVAVDWGTTTTLASAISAGVLTSGAPPRGLLGQVRFHGQAHSGYETYRKRKADAARVRRRSGPSKS